MAGISSKGGSVLPSRQLYGKRLALKTIPIGATVDENTLHFSQTTPYTLTKGSWGNGKPSGKFFMDSAPKDSFFLSSSFF